MGCGHLARCLEGRCVLLFGGNDGHLLPAGLSGADAEARERHVLCHRGRGRSGRVSGLQALQASGGGFARDAPQDRSRRLPRDRNVRGAAVARGSRAIGGAQPASLPSSVQIDRWRDAKGVCRGASAETDARYVEKEQIRDGCDLRQRFQFERPFLCGCDEGARHDPNRLSRWRCECSDPLRGGGLRAWQGFGRGQ